ncbi:MAG TPA: lysylphosphatidylglycerol synthase transmembrane domain-containing protein, partial [Sedimentisphaerales bacterium]|nr:lysylphosphatidylglycerol synthase transmembrane domain-containing protein [Sedimentisphaerales bacterium]
MADGKADRRRRVLLAVRISVVVGGLILAAIWVFSEQIWTDLKGAFARMDLWVFACVFAVFCAGELVVGLRWWLLLRTQGVFIGFWAAVRLYFLGWFYNNVMPGSVGGDLIRVWYVTKHTEKKFEAGLSVFVDRAIGLLGTLIIAFFFYFAFLWPEKIPLVAAVFRHWWFVLLAAGAPVTALSAHPRGRRLMRLIWSSLCSGWKKLVNAGRLYGRKPLT